MKDNKFIVDYKLTGILKLNIDNVIKDWNHLCCLSEWRSDNTWKLIKYIRIDSSSTELKYNISEKQAKELIEKLSLKSTSSIFKSGFTWRRDVDIECYNNWQNRKMNLGNTLDVVSLEIAKEIKAEGFNLPTYFYYLDKDMSFNEKGLKRVKLGKRRMNHNKFDEFIYSAPTLEEYNKWKNKKTKL